MLLVNNGWSSLFFPPHTHTQGINGGYYSAALQQAHSTTTHEAPHSAMPHVPSVGQPQAMALPVSAVSTAPSGIGHGLVSKSPLSAPDGANHLKEEVH